MADDKFTFTVPDDWTPEDDRIFRGLVKAAQEQKRIRQEEEQQRNLRKMRKIMNMNKDALT